MQFWTTEVHGTSFTKHCNICYIYFDNGCKMKIKINATLHYVSHVHLSQIEI